MTDERIAFAFARDRSRAKANDDESASRARATRARGSVAIACACVVAVAVSCASARVGKARTVTPSQSRSRSRSSAIEWMTEGERDFTALAIETPWRVTNAPSIAFDRVSKLGDADVGSGVEVSSAIAQMIGEAILDHRNGKKVETYPGETGAAYRAVTESVPDDDDDDVESGKTGVVGNGTNASSAAEGASARDGRSATRVAALGAGRGEVEAERVERVGVDGEEYLKAYERLERERDATAVEEGAREGALEGENLRLKEMEKKASRLALAPKLLRERLQSNQARQREVREMQRALLANPDFAADYGEDAFANVGGGDAVEGVYQHQMAELKGLRMLVAQYIVPKPKRKRAHIPLLGAFMSSDGAQGKGECKILYFYHVPRTGGGTLLGHFGKIGVDVERFERSKYAAPDSELARVQEEDENAHWNRVVSKSLEGGYHVIAHHVGRSGLLQMSEKLLRLRKEAASRGCEMKSFTVLREPLKHDLSLAASSTAKSYSDIINAQTRFLLVNAGNVISRAWPQQLTSENADLPSLLERTTELLEQDFDYVFTLEDINAMITTIDGFFGVNAAEDFPLEASLRHVSDYGSSRSREDVARVIHSYAAAEESDWLDEKIYAWAQTHREN